MRGGVRGMETIPMWGRSKSKMMSLQRAAASTNEGSTEQDATSPLLCFTFVFGYLTYLHA